MTEFFLLTKNHRFLKNNIFGEFVITIHRNIQPAFHYIFINKSNNTITELRTILQRESQNS